MLNRKNQNQLGQIVTVKLLILLLVRGKQMKTINILMASEQNALPFTKMAFEHYAFVSRNCTYQNCYVTPDPLYLDNITEFDALIFNAVNIFFDGVAKPPIRSPRQLYILCSVEPAAFYKLNPTVNGFFNYTWTYKLDSDLPCPYIIVRDKYENVIGPRTDMNWINIENMKPVSKYLRNKLKKKKIAAAWFVSHCNAESKRSQYAEILVKEMKRYNLELDIYGDCGKKKCGRELDECYALIESDYYFYFSFENTICDDYVTEKLLTPLEHYAVPVVYGGANYARFMPDGMYLNANDMLPRDLAKTMHEIISDPKKYHKFFRWHKYYSFHDADERPDTNMFCQLCEFLNKKLDSNETKTYSDIVSWYNEPQDWNYTSPVRKPVQPTKSAAINYISAVARKIDSFKDFFNNLLFSD